MSRDGGGLWRLRFDSIEHPERGGTLELLLDGTEPPYLSKPDNMTIDTHGHLLIQEDPGNNAHRARIVGYDIASGRRAILAQFDAALFSGTTPPNLTQDEESSGIIDGREVTATAPSCSTRRYTPGLACRPRSSSGRSCSRCRSRTGRTCSSR